MRPLMLILSFITLSLFISCQNESKSVAISGKGDFTGYEMTPVPGSNLQRAVKKNESGKLMELGFVKDGRKHGQWVEYGNIDNEIPTKVSNYVDGLISGVVLELSSRGQVETVTTYLQNELDGNYAKYKYGRPLETASYVNGKMEGKYNKYFENNGKIQQEVSYVNGVMEGPYRYYNEEGEVVLEYAYKNGKKVEGSDKK